MTNLTKAQIKTLESLLAARDITNEDGGQITDFTYQNRDALDFANVSRGDLLDLMTAAFEAGQKAA